MHFQEYQNFIKMVEGEEGYLELLHKNAAELNITLSPEFIEKTSQSPFVILDTINCIDPTHRFHVIAVGVNPPDVSFNETVFELLEDEHNSFVIDLGLCGGTGNITYSSGGKYDRAKMLNLYVGKSEEGAPYYLLIAKMFLKQNLSNVMFEVEAKKYHF